MKTSSKIRYDLSGQIAIVTGASSGLGRATAQALAEAGALTIVNHPPKPSSDAKAAAVVAEIEASGGQSVAIAADVSKEDQVNAMVAEAVRRFGTVHILVANAGIERPAAIQDMSLADWQAVIDINLTGAFLAARAATREFLHAGQCRHSRPRPARSSLPVRSTRSSPGRFRRTMPLRKGA